MNRTYKVMTAQASQSLAWQFIGFENGKAVYQSRKLWRHQADCARAAKRWVKNAT